jgi:hypothetical protein
MKIVFFVSTPPSLLNIFLKRLTIILRIEPQGGVPLG